MNKENNKTVRIKVRLFEEENEKLKRVRQCADCLNRDFYAYFAKVRHKPKPKNELWALLNALYSVHNGFKDCAKYEPSAMEICKEIECLILDLQEVG